MPGLVREVVVDTAFFTGNYPSFASVEGVAADRFRVYWALTDDGRAQPLDRWRAAQQFGQP
jgi:allantoicase